MTVRTSLARPGRRDPDRPTLRERAAALRASASRILHRRQGDRAPVFTEARDAPADWSSPPEGFMAYPALNPQCFMALRYALPKEALRLYRLASAEMALRAPHLDPGRLAELRRDLRLEELRAAAFGRPAIDAEAANEAPDDVARETAIGFVHEDGTVSYRDAGGQFWVASVDEWISFTITRLASIAMQETTRRLNLEGAHLDEPERFAVEDRLRRELRTDDLRALAFGARWSGGKNSIGAPDPILQAIEAAREATRWANEDLPGDEAPARSPENEAADAERAHRTDAEDRAYLDVFKLRPTTRSGLFALVDFAREHVEFQADMARSQGGLRDDGRTFPVAPDVLGVIRDGMAMLLGDVREAVEADPVFEAIAACRTAEVEHGRLYAICDDLPDDAPEWSPERAARRRYWTLFTDRVCRTSPTTLAGAQAMARFARDFAERQGLNAEDHMPAILDALAGTDVSATTDGDASSCVGPAEPTKRAPHDRENADLIALGREWEATCERGNDADEALARASALYETPPCPAELRVVQFDLIHDIPRTRVVETSEGGCRALAYGENEIAQLRSQPRIKTVASKWGSKDVPCPKTQERADQIIAAWDRWQAEITVRRAAHGLPELEQEADRLDEERYALADRICAAPVRTLAGLAVKARLARVECSAASLDAEADEHLPGEPEKYALTVAADVLRMVGDPSTKRAEA